MKLGILVLSSGVALATLGMTNADALTLVPPDLNPGDRYRLVFVTSGKRDAISTNIDDYNNFVSSAANAVPEIAALGTTWNAIASTATVSAINNTATTGMGVPIYLLDGVKVADNYLDLWNGSIDTPIDLTENGIKLPGNNNGQQQTPVWTGTLPDGSGAQEEGNGGFFNTALGVASNFNNTPTAPIYGSWSAFSGNDLGIGWVTFSSRSMTSAEAFYGLSAELTVPNEQSSVPEPSSFLSMITIGGLLLGSAVKKVRS